MSKALENHISTEQPLTFSCKRLKWIDGKIMESQGILRVVPILMENNRVYLNFHIFDIPEGEEFVLIGRPIEPLVNPNRDRVILVVKVRKETIPVSLVLSCNTITEARPEQDPLEEAVCTIQEGQTQPSLDEDATHFTQEIDPDDQSKLDEGEKPQPYLSELKPLPPGLKYAFLHNNRATPVVISDKLRESETQRFVAVLEKY